MGLFPKEETGSTNKELNLLFIFENFKRGRCPELEWFLEIPIWTRNALAIYQ